MFDFEIEPGLSFGEWLRQSVEDGSYVEKSGYFADRVNRVAERLQIDRLPEERLQVVVPWFNVFNAFTAPGRYIYFSRRLLERCPDDACVALVVAHEIAHHDLGHLDFFQGWIAKRFSKLDSGRLLVLFFRTLQKRLYSPEHECDAGQRGLELCLNAGYDPSRCLYFFHIAELIALDYGDLDAVYGHDRDSDEELSPDADLMTKARIWWYQRARGYLPIQDRVALLRKWLDQRDEP